MQKAPLEKSWAFYYDIICYHLKGGLFISHFFIFESTIVPDQQVFLSLEDSHHATKVLRMKVNDTVTLSNGQTLFKGIILSLTPQVACHIISELPSTEPEHKITLYQGVPKGEKMEYLLQKGTEAGIHAFAPVAMERSIAKISLKDEEKKLQRWNKITLEAAKQSKRVIAPVVHPVLSFAQLLKKINTHMLFLVPWENEINLSLTTVFKNHPNVANIGVLIGPEGGISPAEIDLLQASGVLPVTLGKRIFRTETAGLACAISLLTLYGDMN